MFTTRVIDINDKDAYNNFVANHAKGHFSQLWEWGQVKSGTGWKPLPLVLEQDGAICGAILMLKRSLPIPGLNKCILYAPRGPVIAVEDDELCRHLFDGVRKLAREHKAIFVKIDPDINCFHEEFKNTLRRNGFLRNETGINFEGVQPNFVFRLDISKPEDELLADMHSKWRYNIRLAQKKGVRIRKVDKQEELETFYALLKETAVRDNFLIRDYAYYEWIWEQMVTQGFAEIFFAEYEGVLVGATLAMITGDKAWYLYGASSNEFRNVMPNYLIQWEMIRWAKSSGCSMYDFRGVSGDMDESNPLYGLYRFKKGFGGQLVEFIGEWDQIISPLFYWMWTHMLPIYQKKIRGFARKK